MNQNYHGAEMDRPIQSAGSVKRARERAQAGLPRAQGPAPIPVGKAPVIRDAPERGQYNTPLRPMPPPPSAAPSRPAPRPKGPGIDSMSGQTISRPTRVPQWPLPGPPSSPMRAGDGEPYRPPPGRPQQAPERPPRPRPSRIPSIVDQSRLQEHTPVFLTPQGIPEDGEADHEFGAQTSTAPSSRLTSSSMGTIPDFPEPASRDLNSQTRRSTNLGPPPSSRRGATSFYSNASYVSPIPEESIKSKSHGSYASSAAMPENWGASSPGDDYSEAFYDDSVTDRSRESVTYDDIGDESKLVRSASIGKKGKPALVVTKSPAAAIAAAKVPSSTSSPFEGGTGYMDESASSTATPPTTRQTPVTTPGEKSNQLTTEAILGSYAAAGSAEPERLRKKTPSPLPGKRLSRLRRPPTLDLDAVRDMEARGSMTSLPDLIRRATRLAAMMDRGKRPASRFENFTDLLDEKAGAGDNEKEKMMLHERHQSGLSDMLAAFPPPAHAAQNGRKARGSWFRNTSWPLAPGRQGTPMDKRGFNAEESDSSPKEGRRCCGMPAWCFILLVILILLVVATAVVIPLEFFVFKNLPLGRNDKTPTDLERCQASLSCQNGGTNVFSQGKCSCICTRGFVGSDCSVGGSLGCTTTNLVSSDGSSTIQNVTLGKAVPRLIADASTNFSIPLSGTAILAKFSSANLSCIAQNSIVTFDGESTRLGAANTEVQDMTDSVDKDDAVVNVALVSVSVITVSPRADTTFTMTPEKRAAAAPTEDNNTRLLIDTSSPAYPGPSSPTATSQDSAPTSTSPSTRPPEETFTVTESVLDFARVAVLYVLQEEDVSTAEHAQTTLQDFFTKASSASRRRWDSVTKQEASRISFGTNKTIDLVDFTIDVGDGAIGRGEAKRSIDKRGQTEILDSLRRTRHGRSLVA